MNKHDMKILEVAIDCKSQICFDLFLSSEIYSQVIYLQKIQKQTENLTITFRLTIKNRKI